jgi:hypothetical protein
MLLTMASCGHGGAGGNPASAGSAGPGVDGALRFLESIPRCAAVPTGMTAHDAREQAEGTQVAVRGILLHNPKWDCPVKGCPGKICVEARRGSGAWCNTCLTRWFVVDPADAARPYMSRARLYLRPAGQAQLALLEAQDCDVVKVNAATAPKEVVLTGTFQGPAGEGGGSHLIGNAHLCTP